MLRMMLPCDVTDCGARGGHFGVWDGDGEGGAGRVGRRRQGRHGLVGAAGRRPRHGAPQHGREHRPVIRDAVDGGLFDLYYCTIRAVRYRE